MAFELGHERIEIHGEEWGEHPRQSVQREQKSGGSGNSEWLAVDDGKIMRRGG